MEKNYTIDKTKVDCYKIRYPKSSDWADITIDYSDRSGRLSISSDYGNWAYYWGSCGCSFKEFLISLNIGYVARKFGEDKYFDLESTIKFYKESIIEDRRSDRTDAEQARDCFDEIKAMNDVDDENTFVFIMHELNNLSKYYDGYAHTVHSISPTFQRFWDGSWRDFIDTLKEEKEVLADTVK